MGVKRSVAACLATCVVVVWGQNSNVQSCISSYNWTINNLGQTPCLVAAYLESGCGQPASVDAIPPGTHYIGPSFADADKCHCSSVTYSVISACGGCQGRSYLNWTMWSYNCSTKYETSFPGTIFAGTSVPQWAYLDVSETNDTFDPVVAAQNVSLTLPSSLFPTGTAATTATVSFLLPSSSTSTPTPSSNSTHSHVGAIVGGVLGGSVGVAIILLALLIWLLKRRSSGIQNEVVFDRTALVSRAATSGTSSPFEQSHGNSYTSSQNMSASSRLITTSSPFPSSPQSMSRRSLDGPSPSIRYFGSPLQPNRYTGFRTDSDQDHIQV